MHSGHHYQNDYISLVASSLVQLDAGVLLKTNNLKANPMKRRDVLKGAALAPLSGVLLSAGSGGLQTALSD
jgi:hypothetical protein